MSELTWRWHRRGWRNIMMRNTQRDFRVGEFVDLKLQPYRQLSFAQRKNPHPLPQAILETRKKGEEQEVLVHGRISPLLRPHGKILLNWRHDFSLRTRKFSRREELSKTLPSIPVISSQAIIFPFSKIVLNLVKCNSPFHLNRLLPIPLRAFQIFNSLRPWIKIRGLLLSILLIWSSFLCL
jgi:hypothetical protein